MNQDFGFLCEISREGLGEAFFKTILVMFQRLWDFECHGKGDNVVM